ncbi:MAG: Gfo/Idh/MocA family oxidoreductase [Opitutaceae bacterium]|nr:Gfo/Idh/MocA family oxidoreductase [Opitutaceae bacterium]
MKNEKIGRATRGPDSSRRNFLRSSSLALGTAVAGSFSFASLARAAGSRASGRLGIALIGCGGRGNDVIAPCLKNHAAWNLDVVALCDVWTVNLEATAAKVQKATGRRPKTFRRHQDLLALPEVDAVIIATPDFSHSPILVDAARAGKHAYVEKPMATRVEDANAAVDAVTKHRIVCQVGTQFRSSGNFAAAAELVRSGALGQIIKVDTSYHRNVPSWIRDFSNVRREDVDWEQFRSGLPAAPFDPRQFRCWQLYKQYSVGLVGLLGVHVIDLGSWLAGDPLPAYAVGVGEHLVFKEREHTDAQECLFYFPKGFILQFSSRLANASPKSEISLYGTNGTMHCPFSPTDTFVAIGDGGGKDRLRAPVTATPVKISGHMENWLECIRANKVQTHADVHAGYAHSIASIIGAAACESGRRVRFDAKARRMIIG